MGAFAIWKGGLGVWGGIGLGCVVGRDRRQALGRDRREARRLRGARTPSRRGSAASGTGGTRSSSAGRPIFPWGLEIDPGEPADRLRRLGETFHPTFLYEALWCFAAAGVLLFDRAALPGRIRPGGLFALYVLIYSDRALWIETLRIDPSHEIGGVRLNVWVAGFAILASAALLRLVATQLETRGRAPAAEGRDHGGAEGQVAGTLRRVCGV